MGTSDTPDTLIDQLDALHARFRLGNKIGPPRDWYRIENATDAKAEVWIYDEIGWFGVTATDMVDELTKITADSIDVHINSPGGSVFDGIAIYSTLRQHPATVNVIIDSLAASIASVIAMAGDTVTIAPNGMMMIHDGLGVAFGNAAEHRDMADLLDKVSDNIASVYAARTDQTADEWRAVMLDEKWYTADEALDAGLVDRIDRHATDDTDNRFDVSVLAETIKRTLDPDPAPDNQFDPAVFGDAIRKAVA